MSKDQAIKDFVAQAQATQETQLGAFWDQAITEAGGTVDTTPYSEEQMNEVKAQLTAAQEEIAKITSDDASDKAAIAAAQEKFAAIEAIMHPAAAKPEGE